MNKMIKLKVLVVGLLTLAVSVLGGGTAQATANCDDQFCLAPLYNHATVSIGVQPWGELYRLQAPNTEKWYTTANGALETTKWYVGTGYACKWHYYGNYTQYTVVGPKWQYMNIEDRGQSIDSCYRV